MGKVFTTNFCYEKGGFLPKKTSFMGKVFTTNFCYEKGGFLPKKTSFMCL
jgi:hypothetical protein